MSECEKCRSQAAEIERLTRMKTVYGPGTQDEIDHLCRQHKEEMDAQRALLAELAGALKLAKDELHEMGLSQEHRKTPRNPEITKIAVLAVDAALDKAKAQGVTL